MLTRTSLEATWKAFAKPWKADLQSLVDEISQTFEHVKDISQFHSLLEAHATHEIGRLNLHNSTESRKIQQQSLAKLSELESMMERVQATILQFSKERDIQQTANYLRQHMDEDLQDPQQTSLPDPGQRQDVGQQSPAEEMCSCLVDIRRRWTLERRSI